MGDGHIYFPHIPLSQPLDFVPTYSFYVHQHTDHQYTREYRVGELG